MAMDKSCPKISLDNFVGWFGGGITKVMKFIEKDEKKRQMLPRIIFIGVADESPECRIHRD